MSAKDFDLDQPLEALVNEAERRFGSIVFETVPVGDISLEVPQIKDMPRYLDKLVGKTRPGQSVDLPLWAKVWPSCVILSMFLSRASFAGDAQVLELGAGVGVAGLALAKRGVQVTVTDIEPDALLFSKIGAFKNGVAENVNVVRCDFTADKLGTKFDMIIGCEILYQDHVYDPLHAFLADHLAEGPKAEIVMALDGVRKSQGFFQRAQDNYAMMRQPFPYKDTESGQERNAVLYRLRRK